MFDQYQIAHDVARFYNIIHDQVDACRHLCRLFNPDSGEAVDVAQAKDFIRSFSNGALVNYDAVYDYAQKIGVEEAKAAVTAIFGISADTLVTRLQTMRGVATYLYNNVLSWDETQMESAADYIDTNVPQWKSIRRRWALSG